MHHVSYLWCSKTDCLKFFIMPEDFLRCSVQHFFPLIHHDQTVYIFCHIFHAVGYQNYCHPGLFVKLCHLIQNLVPSLRVKSRSWLIQYKYLWMHGKNPCDRHTPFLPS